MSVIDNAYGMRGNLKNIRGLQQFAVYVDSDGERYQLARFMYYEDAIAFADKVEQRNLFLYSRIAVERIA